jgi:hypothetical protein
VAVQAPAVALTLPLVGALYVYGQVRIVAAIPRQAPMAARISQPARAPRPPRPPAVPRPAPRPAPPVLDLPSADEPAAAENRWLVLIFGILFALVGVVLGGMIYMSDRLGM